MDQIHNASYSTIDLTIAVPPLLLYLHWTVHGDFISLSLLIKIYPLKPIVQGTGNQKKISLPEKYLDQGI